MEILSHSFINTGMCANILHEYMNTYTYYVYALL